MGLNSSRYSLRFPSDGLESERPPSKSLAISENVIPDAVGEADVTAVDNAEIGTMRSRRSSLQQIKVEGRGPLEIGERAVDPRSRILPRTRRVNVAPFRRLCFRNNGRSTELSQRQQAVEVEEICTEHIVMNDDARVGDIGTEVPMQSSNSFVSIQTSEMQSPRAVLSEDHERYTTHYDADNMYPSQRSRIGNSNFSGTHNNAIYRGDIPVVESRRNWTGQFWDTFLHTTSLRHNSNQDLREDVEPILLLYHSRTRLPNSRAGSRNSLFGEVDNQRTMATNIEDRRRRFRSQMWALHRLSAHLEQIPNTARPYALWLRHDGSRNTSHLRDETATRASISRILMLAEALFRVLEDIHHQSVAISQSAGLSLGYLPAPNAVVESIPTRNYQRIENNEDCTIQCHICLMEYLDGDQMRVLPCGHEYHTICIDKWLKEVHRICPLCRHDVCEVKVVNGSC